MLQNAEVTAVTVSEFIKENQQVVKLLPPTHIRVNAKISVLIICVEAIIYLLLCNLHNCSFTFGKDPRASKKCFTFWGSIAYFESTNLA